MRLEEFKSSDLGA